MSFVLLLSAARTGELRVRGTVAKNFRPAYDILVRPRGSSTSLERSQGLVPDNYLSGIFGGISLGQYHQIEHLHGVEVAAPIANIGYVVPFENTLIPITRVLTKAPFQLYRVTSTAVANGGLSRYPQCTQYVYYTRRDRFGLLGTNKAMEEILPDGSPLQISQGFQIVQARLLGTSPFHQCNGTLLAYSSRSPRLSAQNNLNGLPAGFVGVQESAYLPVLLSAVDPAAEQRLLRLGRAMVAGRYLRPADDVQVGREPGLTLKYRQIPVIASSRSFVDDRLQVTVRRLDTAGALDLPAALTQPSAYSIARNLPGQVVESRNLSVQALDQRLLAHRYLSTSPYLGSSPIAYSVVGRDRITPVPVTNPASTWTDPLQESHYFPPPADNMDVQYRRLTNHAGSNAIDANGVYGAADLRVVGRFDPEKLPGFSPLSRVPLETYYPPTVEPADAASRAALHGRPLLPTQNVGGYISQPPLLLTTLRAMRPLLDSKLYTDPAKAPISVIRVRVADVHGDDALSRERIKVVAQEIHDATGLAIDITAGSSPHPVLVDLPPGRFGQPALVVREGWIQKGVSVRFLDAVDRKSLALFGLILLVCVLFVANGAFAGVRARRTEIGTLMCLGWPASRIFVAVLAELAIVGLAAGVAGALLAAVVVEALSLHLGVIDTLVVVPVAVVLCVLAGLVPAWRAARGVPLDAVRPPVVAASRALGVHGVTGMAVVNLLRLPARTLIGSAGLVIGVAALTVLVGIDRAFAGTLVGNLLGSAVAVQVRGPDRLSVAMTVVLAGLSVADVVYLNLRERAAEIATLRTCGWSDVELSRLVISEAALLGLAGGLVGAAVGIGLGRGLLGLPVTPLLQAAAIAVAGSVLICSFAAGLPLLWLSRMTAPTMLAEE